jgi:cytochrome c553
MKTFIVASAVLLLFSCQTEVKKSENIYFSEIVEIKEHPGKKLMETNCYVCHSPSADHDKRIAPPMIAIKNHYISKNTTKEEFKKALLNWINNPSKENSKMKGAIKKFGIMPKTPFSEETILLIADYMFDNKIDKPKWFKNHQKMMKKG